MKNIIKYLISIFLCICISNSYLNGCDCSWGGSFINSFEHEDVIFIGQITGHEFYRELIVEDSVINMPIVMNVRISEILFLDEENLDYRIKMKTRKLTSLRILGYVDGDCGAPINQFSIGSTWVFKMNVPQSNYLNLDYVLSDCSTNYLLVKNDTVVGNIAGINQRTTKDKIYMEMPLTMFKEKLNQRILQLN